MKKCFGWVLVVLLVVGLSFSVSAGTQMRILQIRVPEFRVGDPITNDPDITCDGARVAQILSWYNEDWEPVSGYFRDNSGYILQVKLRDPAGQRFDTNGLVVLADRYSCSWWLEDEDHSLMVDIYVDFGIKQAKKANLENLPAAIAPGPVTDLSELYVSGPAYLDSARWVDENRQPVSRFEEGRLYYLETHIAPGGGYEFRDFFFLSANIGVAESSWILNEREVVAWYPYTPAQTTISAVWIRGVPEQIQMGDALLTDLDVPAGASYTVDAVWLRLPAQERVHEVDRNGSYLLLLRVNANEGCTFADKVAITADGQKDLQFWNYDNPLFLCKAYNMGLQSVERVDATVTAPQLDGVPQLPVSGDGRYDFTRSLWLSSKTANMMDGEECTAFVQGNYHFLILIAQAAQGYAFPDDAQVYINGRKAAPLLDINAGDLRFTVIPFGKLIKVVPGDLDRDGDVDEADAVCLLRHVLLPEQFALEQEADFTDDGKVDEQDVVHLLRHVLMPGRFSLK